MILDALLLHHNPQRSSMRLKLAMLCLHNLLMLNRAKLVLA
ncbi:Uncharacterised protein [Janthinobacterium lividum]|nr:hypothetical protein JANLI_06710 [Janthinobacterium lividum]STS86248.1 Uncharacterised protein [Janthinobacterium lividum]